MGPFSGCFLAQFLRHFLLAVQFFTRIPITGQLAQWVGFSPAMLRASAAHFPAVGALVGGGTACVLALLMWALPQLEASLWVAATLSTALGVLLTGAFHEDGLADTVDGLGGAVSRERALDIMKDSRIGTYGAMALVLAVFCKISLLVLLLQMGFAKTMATGSGAVSWLSLSWACTGLLAAHMTSRFAPLWLIRLLAHVGDTPQSKSKPLADSISRAGLLVGGLWWSSGMLFCWCFIPIGAVLVGTVGAALGTLFMGWRLFGRLQGYTGDGLGATQQLSEIGFYLGLCVFAAGGGA
jgi:adenosylcobinamide-GDP ribazoletransferase